MWASMTPILSRFPHTPLNGSVPCESGGWTETLSELERYRTYADDWDGQGAKGISGDVIDAGVALVAVLRSHAVTPPQYVLPGFDGTVGFEWTIPGDGSITLDITGPGTATFERFVPGGTFESIKIAETVTA